jgi:diguanylate cyclase (GGDEF)-like protein/PAS domain S-box-containing protein
MELVDYAVNLEPFIGQIPDYALYMLDPSGRVISWNVGIERLKGYTAQEIIGHDFSIFYTPEDVAADNPHRALDIAAREGTYQEEGLRVRKDGTRFWATVTITALRDKEGKLQGFAKLTRDITERKTSEAALQAAREAKYRAVFENSHDAIFLTRSEDGAFLAVNPAACELFGYSEQELTSMRREQVLDTADPRLSAALAKRNETGEAAAELTFIRKGGERFEGRVTSKAFVDESGQQMACTSIHDITERKQAEEALRQSEKRLRLLYESAPLGIAHLDMNGRVTSANRVFAELAGYPLEEVIGFTHIETTLPEDRAVIAASLEDVYSGKIDTFNYERRLLRKDGSTIWVRVNVRMINDEQGRPQEGILIYEDITGRKQAEEALRQSEEQFRLLYENAPVGIAHIDLSGVCTFANRKLGEIVGYPPGEVIGLSYLDVTPPDERDISKELMAKLLSGEIETSNRERRVLRKDGSTVWVRQTAGTVHDSLGKPQCGIAMFEDITERKQAEESLRQSEEKFRATFEHAPLGIAECSVDGRFIEGNSKLVEILGYTKDEIAHLTVRDVTHPSEVEQSLENLQKLATGEADTYVMEKRYIRKDRSIVWVNVTASLAPIHDKPQHLIVAVEDITARRKAEEDLKRAIESSYHQASHDMLTGLANRTSFGDHLGEALSYAKRDGHLVAVHLLDLDGFKSINDTLGHHVGDLLLKEVAKRITANVRTTDFAARLGGDEFVIVQTHLAGPAAAGVLAGKLVEDLGRQYILEGQQVHSGTSLGIALYPNDAQDPEDLIKQADLALYEAKHRGRFNYQFYRKELGAAFREALRVEQELTRALRDNRFCLHYQPQFDLKSGRITGIEALLRWRHPARGMIAAAEFIQDAERSKLMPSIGEWTLRTACRQYKEWIDSGLTAPLTLNVSSLQLRDPRFLQTLQRILDETGLPPQLLQLAMREGALWDPKFSKGLLKQMKASGLRLALDDFGAEMTALSTFDRFPLDAVKPGHGLIRELPSQKRDAATLAAIIGVAHDRKIAVCADGVETAPQLAAAKEQGCDSAQGYLLSSPMDTDDMQRRIEAELAH